MKIMSLFICFFCTAISLYAASSTDADKRRAEELVQVCSRFDSCMKDRCRSDKMEIAGSLVDTALSLYESGFVFPHLKDAQTHEELLRKAVVYSSQRLIDAINEESRVYAEPPLEQYLLDHIVQLKKRRESEISAPFVKKIVGVERMLRINQKALQCALFYDISSSDIMDISTELNRSNKSSACCQLQ